ncbi:MAG: winged helix-turn-helix transcriptional regulator [Candidatus Thermoplasmatota archaeon]|nr:winged helix-turn-helix transcriptional regulator [Candidatus Thermoplasmatota archaeon]MDI6887920.1 winged helix-turn-helix transcriptional regulator [Candidatus Thermoplasmatota archaeon]
MEELLLLESRRKIYRVIESNQGIHLREISRILGMHLSLVEHHLNYMAKHELINAIEEGGYKRYYTGKEIIGARDKRVLALLRQKMPLKIVLFILEHPNSRHKDILTQLNISGSTLSFHLKKLVKAGMLNVGSQGSEKSYDINDKRAVLRLLIEYKPAGEELTESFVELWEQLKV